MTCRKLLPAFAALIVLAAARPATAEILYAIGDGGASLLRFDSGSPSAITRIGSFSGDDSFLDAIDFRPGTGQLFGYRSATNTYVTVNPFNGVLTSATSPGGAGAPTNTFFLGMDFNPTIDRLRVVTDSTQNIVFNPNSGTAASFTALAYAGDDVNAAFVPLVVENAYDNNIANFGRPTQQYVLDYGLNVLATLANNAGTLRTVGEVTLNGSVLDFDEYVGFDILTETNGADTAYALLTVAGTTGLYTIDLGTGAATSLGDLGSGFGPVYSLAVAPRSVPEPGSAALLAAGAGVLGLLAARRMRNQT